jgi:hypothetical protein|tara:strand:- start:920 stop:1168 length:249 start_codon:yes stop_codon:yes gene_type:complete
MEYYYIYTQLNFDRLDKTKIYSRFLSNDGYVVLLATEELTGYYKSFVDKNTCMSYISDNQHSWGNLFDLDFEMQYLPTIDDE